MSKVSKPAVSWIISTLLIAAMTACASIPSYGSQARAWIGRSDDSLKQDWGAPSQRVALAGGGEVLVYDRTQEIKSGGGTVFTNETQTQTTHNSDGSTSTNPVVV